MRSPRAGFFLLFLLINGCAGANSPSATAPSATKSSSASTPTTASSPASHTATATTAAPAPTSTTPAPGASASRGATNARLPAKFVITGHGSLSPSSVAAPGHVTIDLTVSSGDGHAHQVVLRTAPPRSLAVSAGGGASLRLMGLRNGQYALIVDGTRAGALIVGAQPGP